MITFPVQSSVHSSLPNKCSLEKRDRNSRAWQELAALGSIIKSQFQMVTYLQSNMCKQHEITKLKAKYFFDHFT